MATHINTPPRIQKLQGRPWRLKNIKYNKSHSANPKYILWGIHPDSSAPSVRAHLEAQQAENISATNFHKLSDRP